MRMQFFAGALTLIASGGLVQAATISGSVWEVSNPVASSATPANVAAQSTPSATFTTTDPMNFNTPGTGPNTIGAFLTSGGAALNLLTGSSSLGLTQTLWDFRGTLAETIGNTISITHDDGITLLINGSTVISSPGPQSTGPASTYTETTNGIASFELIYGECCSLPADLNVANLHATPLPGALPLLATSLGFFGFLGWRKRRTGQGGPGVALAI